MLFIGGALSDGSIVLESGKYMVVVVVVVVLLFLVLALCCCLS